MAESEDKRFRIALSFPGAKREFVEAVAEHLAKEVGRERVLYDQWHEAEFARPRLATYLPPLYYDESDLIAVFLCADYQTQEWCGLEWDAIFDLIKKREEDAVMLLRFDDTEIAGLYSTHGYVWIEDRPAAEIAELILTRWRQAIGKPAERKTDSAPDGSQAATDSVGGEPPDRHPDPPWKANPLAASKLPRTGDYLVGRESELAILDNAWANPKTSILQIVAPGGVGKTQLVKKWQESLLDRDDHGGAVRAYDWSFYSQGTQQQASADDFFDRALRWFREAVPENYKDPWAKGERLAELVKQRRTLLILDGMEPLQHPPGPMAGELTDPSIKALLEGLQRGNPGLCIVTTREAVLTLNEMSEPKRRTIVLDILSPEAGAELLQQYGVTGDPGELRQASKDVEGHALALILLGTYLKLKCHGDVAQRSEALLFQGHERYAAHAHKVMASYELWFEKQDDIGRAAVAILRLMGLFNRPADAGCLAALRKKPPIPGLTDALFASKSAQGSSGSKQMPESPGSKRVQGSPGSKRVQGSHGDSGDEVFERDDELWDRAVERLRDARLLADEYFEVPEGRPVIAPVASPGVAASKERPSPGGPTQDDGATPTGFGDVSDAMSPGSHPGLKPVAAPRLRATRHAGDDSLDAHPFVREHFAAQLAERFPDAAREAHRRLYEHLKSVPKDELPDNLNDMMPLFDAVAHGCKARLVSRAYDEVFAARINRGNANFAVKKLGAIGGELATLSSFFTVGWKHPSQLLSEYSRSWLLNTVGYDLRALGRLRESVQPIVDALTNMIHTENWQQGSINAVNLCELSLALGNVSSAVRQGEQSVELADRSGDLLRRTKSRAQLGQALFEAGKPSVSLGVFEEVEKGCSEKFDFEYLPSVEGYCFCELLLDVDQNSYGMIRKRAQYSLRESSQKQGIILDIALDHLTLGRTYLLETRKKRLETRKKKQEREKVSALDSAEHYLKESVSLLRQSGMQNELHRAALWRVKYEIKEDKSQIELAERDMTEAERIAKRGSMLIFQIEAALERTRLALVLGDKKQAKEKLDEARELIRQTEKPYVPHKPDWADWDPPDYIGVFKEGDIVGYHRRNPEIEALQRAIEQERG